MTRGLVAFAIFVVVVWFSQDWLRARVQRFAAEWLANEEEVKLGAGKPAQSIEDIEALSRLCDKISRTWPTQPVEPADADRLERYMQPDQPPETRIRAMRFGQVIGTDRFRRILIAGFSDPDPRVRRTSVGKADTDLDLWPSMVPSLANDPDAQVRGTYTMWLSTIEFRTRTGRDPSTGKSVRPPPSPAR